MYALGWTQHTVGVQNIRLAAILQLLLGNIGVAGGGINALRGEPNVQGSTDHCLLWHILPGYMAVPRATWQTLADYNEANTPVSRDPESANWWRNKPKYITSLLKGVVRRNGTKENDFGYRMLPKAAPGKDYSYLYIFDRMYNDRINGGFVFGHQSLAERPQFQTRTGPPWTVWTGWWWGNSTIRKHPTTGAGPGWTRAASRPRSSSFPRPTGWRSPGPVTNSGRWLIWHNMATKPIGRCRTMGAMIVDIMNGVRRLYARENGAYPDPLLKMDWPAYYDAEDMARRINGRFLSDTVVKGKAYKAGDQVPNFGALADDGTTLCLNWLYSGSYTEEEGNKAKRRDLNQTEMQKNIGLFPNYSWCWPVNRRILYNRASVDLKGNPLAPRKAVIKWNGNQWEGDVPDGGWPPMATGKGRYPFIMRKHGFGQIYGPGRPDGPLRSITNRWSHRSRRIPFQPSSTTPVSRRCPVKWTPWLNPGTRAFPLCSPPTP